VLEAGALLKKTSLGRIGELLAARWYESRGGRVVSRNWRPPSPWRGELDLVVATCETVIFCEVKTRTQSIFGDPAEAVQQEKLSRIRRLATSWLLEGGASPLSTARTPLLRFDVACVFLGSAGIEAAKLGRGQRVYLPDAPVDGLTWGIVEVLEGVW
jgi:putative endonuclease